MRDLAMGGTEEGSKEGEWLGQGRRVGRTSQADASDSEKSEREMQKEMISDIIHLLS